ncbi:MAG: efflux RND transporter periplasmic adaptor subunit [Pseudomonadota bacterium]
MTSGIADTSGQDTVLTPRRRNGPWLITGIGAILVVGGLYYGIPSLLQWLSSEDSISRERIRVDTVLREDFVRDISVQGKVVASVSPTIYTTNQGSITLEVASGERVEENQILAVIDSPELTNQLQQAQAQRSKLSVDVERNDIEARKQMLANKKNVDVGKLQLTAARRELARATEGRMAISGLDFQKSQDEVEAAEYAFDHAVADADLDAESLAFEARAMQLQLDQQSLLVSNLQRQVDELTLRSPVGGIVGNLLVEDRQDVASNTPVMSVVDLSQFEIEADVPQSYADDISIGMPAEISNGATSFDAEIISISPEIIDDQVTTRLQFVGSPPEGLRRNQRLTTRVLLEQKNNVLTVKRGQFIEQSSGRFAYRVDGNIATRLPISIGARSLAKVEVLSGLNEGDEIIISSVEQFRGVDSILLTN